MMVGRLPAVGPTRTQSPARPGPWSPSPSTVLVNEGSPTPSHLSFAAATPSRSGLQQLGTIALLLYVVQLLTCEPDLTIRQLAYILTKGLHLPQVAACVDGYPF